MTGAAGSEAGAGAASAAAGAVARRQPAATYTTSTNSYCIRKRWV